MAGGQLHGHHGQTAIKCSSMPSTPFMTTRMALSLFNNERPHRKKSKVELCGHIRKIKNGLEINADKLAGKIQSHELSIMRRLLLLHHREKKSFQ